MTLLKKTIFDKNENAKPKSKVKADPEVKTSLERNSEEVGYLKEEIN
jgi:hypothetical protein